MNIKISVEEIAAIDKTPILFVVGKGRSGTTLLQVLLNAHPNIIAPPESPFIMLMYYKYGKTKVWTKKTIANFCNDLFKEKKIRLNWRLVKKDLSDTLLSAKNLLTFPLVCKIILRLSSPEKKEVRVFSDKNPIYQHFLPEIKKIFPDAKYLHMIRDYRGNIASHQRVFKVKQASSLAYRWLKINQAIEDRKIQESGKYYTLKYESLVIEPESCMKEICSFLKIPFIENIIEDHTSSIYTGFQENTARFKNIHKSLFQPITSSHIDEWKTKLSAKEVSEIESIAGTYGATQYNYPIFSEKLLQLSPLKLLRIKINYVLRRVSTRMNFRYLWFYYFKKKLKNGNKHSRTE